MTKFIYSILRFVPEPASGEFVNIGAIAGSDDTQEWECRLINAPNRIHSLARSYGRDASLVVSHAQRLEELVKDYDSSFSKEEDDDSPRLILSEAWLNNQSGRLNHMLQLSDPNLIFAEDVTQAMDSIAEEIFPIQETRTRATDKRAAIRAAKKAFLAQGLILNKEVFTDINVAGPVHSSGFDLVVANGKLVQLVNTWSFQIQEVRKQIKDILAWGWNVRDLKASGGTAVVNSKSYKIGPEVDVKVVFVPPEQPESQDMFREAQAVFDSLQVGAYSIEQASVVAERAKQLLCAA